MVTTQAIKHKGINLFFEKNTMKNKIMLTVSHLLYPKNKAIKIDII